MSRCVDSWTDDRQRDGPINECMKIKTILSFPHHCLWFESRDLLSGIHRASSPLLSEGAGWRHM